MRYHKQFHNWPFIHVLAAVCAGACLIPAIIRDEPEMKVGMLVSAIFLLFVAFMLWRSRAHYLEIDQDRIIHNGFKQWTVQKKDIVQVEHGKKSWAEEYDPFLKVHALGREYPVDNGFLISEQRVEELAQAMKSRANTFRS